MRTSEGITKITEALIAVQSSIKAAPEDSLNPHFKSRYADLASVWGACREALSKNNLAVIQSPTFAEGRVILTTRLMHKSGEWVENDLSIKPDKDTAQGIGSCITYARRYSLSALIGIVTDEDDDGNAACPPPKKIYTPPPKPVSPPFDAKDPKRVEAITNYLKDKHPNISTEAYPLIIEDFNGKDFSQLATIINKHKGD